MAKLSNINHLKPNLSSSDDMEHLNAEDCDKLLNYKIVNTTDDRLIKQLGIHKVTVKLRKDLS